MAVRIYSLDDLPETIGNDIVDLHEQEPDLHPGFMARVFTTAEQDTIGSDTGLLWLNWAAKEAGYKAIKRKHPETVFSPREFELKNSNLLVYRQYQLHCRLSLTGEYACCVCSGNQRLLQAENLHSWIQTIPFASAQKDLTNDPSAAVRLLAKSGIANILGCAESDVEISKKQTDFFDDKKSPAPSIIICGEKTPHLLSFSHHGRYIACAVYFLPFKK